MHVSTYLLNNQAINTPQPRCWKRKTQWEFLWESQCVAMPVFPAPKVRSLARSLAASIKQASNLALCYAGTYAGNPATGDKTASVKR